MGKTDTTLNKPVNSSFSYCLEKLRTYVRIKKNSELKSDTWNPYLRDDLRPLVLSDKSKQRFLNHFNLLKIEFKMDGYFEIESANNFPADCGLASSASSFAALTLTTHDWFIKNADGTKKSYLAKELAKLSQKGSGSSCRSFFSPWALWHAAGAESIQIPYTDLKHQVLFCDENIKQVSSSEAHVRVLTSDLFKGRTERAEVRLQKLIESLRAKNWPLSFELCWNEFWDMQGLFHTSSPAFMYVNANTIKALKALHNNWLINKDGPLITMDAGSNIHLLYRSDQVAFYQEVIQQFRSEMPIWTDEGYLAKN